MLAEFTPTAVRMPAINHRLALKLSVPTFRFSSWWQDRTHFGLPAHYRHRIRRDAPCCRLSRPRWPADRSLSHSGAGSLHDSDPHARLPDQGENRLIASGDTALSPALELGLRLPQLRLQSWVAGAGDGGRGLVKAPIVKTGKQEASGLRGD